MHQLTVDVAAITGPVGIHLTLLPFVACPNSQQSGPILAMVIEMVTCGLRILLVHWHYFCTESCTRLQLQSIFIT